MNRGVAIGSMVALVGTADVSLGKPSRTIRRAAGSAQGALELRFERDEGSEHDGAAS